MKNTDGTYDKPDRSVARYWVNDSGRDTDRNVWLSTDDGLYSAGLKFAALGDVQYRWLPIIIPTFPPKPEPPKPLVIEAGRYYRTRDSRKAFVLGRSPFEDAVGSSHPWWGFIDGVSDDVETWRESGTCFDTDHPHDIIAEWTEPNPRVKVPRLFTAKHEGKEVRGCYFPRDVATPHDHVFPDPVGTLWCKSSQLTDIVYTTPEYEHEL